MINDLQFNLEIGYMETTLVLEKIVFAIITQ